MRSSAATRDSTSSWSNVKPGLLLRQVDQDDIGVLARAVEDDMFAVRRDVEAAQVSLVAEMCDLSPLAGAEIDPPEIKRFWDWPVDEMPLIEEAITAGADPQLFLRPGCSDREREIVLLAISSHGL